MHSNCLFFLLRASLILVLFLEVSCESISPFPRCISADNFGFEAVTVSAYYPKGSKVFEAKDGENTSEFSPNQVIRWIDTGLVTNGETIKLKTSGMWTSWAKSNKKYSSVQGIEFLGIENGKIEHVKNENRDEEKRYEITQLNQSVIPLDRICGPYSIKNSVISGCSDNKCQYIDEGLKDDIKKGSYGIPCWFRNGYGAYLLLKRDGDPDPNETVNIMRFPKSPVVHLGYKSTDEGGTGAFSSADHPIKDTSCQNLELQQGWKVYVKILDQYYWDNAGGYTFEFISGVRQEHGMMIFETIRKKIKDTLITQGSEAIFKRIVENDSFKSLVHSLLVLFVMVSALLYILGMIQQSMPDFLIRTLKVSLVLMLISPGSWQFFYNNLLSLFINGTDVVIGIINGHSGMRSYNQDAPFAFLDYMIRDKIFSPVVWNIKMRALIISDFLGIFGVIFIIVIVLTYIFLCIYAFAIYLAGLIGISLLIALMPIFFVGILFSKLKPLFDGWLTQCISFSLQSIMIFTLLSLFGSLIMNTYYRLLGFTTCYNKWMEVKIPPLLDKAFYDWTPGQKYIPKVINLFGKSNVCDSLNCSHDSVSRFTFTGGGAVISVPPEYTEKDFRYIDYPYFDPDTTSSKNPDGISVKENSKFTTLANLLNSLMALSTVDGDAIARLIQDIKSEIERLGLGNSYQFSEIVASQNKNIPDNYGNLQKDVKSALISLVVQDITDPTPKEELEKQYDYSIIKKIKKGYLIIWEELLILLLLALLIYLMRSFVTNIGSSLGGGSPMSTMLSRVWDGFFHPHGSGIGGKIGQFLSGIKYHYWQDKIGGDIEKVGYVVAKTVKRTPILGMTVKFTSEIVDAVTIPSSAEFEFQKKFNKQLKKLTYYRAVIGSHLSYSGFEAIKHLRKYALDRISGEKETELWKDMKLQYKLFIEKLREEILGTEKDKLSVYLPPKDLEDKKSPFSRSDPIDISDPDIVDSDIEANNNTEYSVADDNNVDYDVVQDLNQIHSNKDVNPESVRDADVNNKLDRDIHNQLLHEKINQYKEDIKNSNLEQYLGDSDYLDNNSEEINLNSIIANKSVSSDQDFQNELGTKQDYENQLYKEEMEGLIYRSHHPQYEEEIISNIDLQKENLETLEDAQQLDDQSRQSPHIENWSDQQQLGIDNKLKNNKKEVQLLQKQLSDDQTIIHKKNSSLQKRGSTPKERLDKLKENQNNTREIKMLKDRTEQIKKQQEESSQDEN